jgi:chaperonin GroEL (HSP60 family)
MTLSILLQYFADRDMFCAGRVPDEDLQRTMKACGGAIQSTVHDLNDETLGTCETFEEKQVGQCCGVMTFWCGSVRIRIRGSMPLTNGSGSCCFLTSRR